MMKTSLFRFLMIISSFLCVTPSSAGPFLYDCSGDNYTSSSLYGANLSRLLSNLCSSVLTSPVLFSSLTENSAVYGLAQCRPDVNSSVCAACLAYAANDTVNGLCPQKKSASAHYEFCVLRYADRPIAFNPANLKIYPIYRGDNNARDPKQYSLQVGMMMSDLVWKAAESPRRIAAASSMVQDNDDGHNSSMNVYAYTWCTMDLTREDCLQCLINVLSSYLACCGGWLGGGMISDSCIVTYNTFVFFNLSVIQSLSSPPRSDPGSGRVISIIAISETAALALLFTLLIFVMLRLKKVGMIAPLKNAIFGRKRKGHFFFDLSQIRAATNNFSNENKLGEGGFGAVFKGFLKNGEEIAVKRLSKSSKQGVLELKNEVAFVAKLQHRNLVRLLGCCLEEEESLLVYEFLPNKSLDKFLFDSTGRGPLDWGTRFKIIEGIAQGLVYLHEDSRLRVIHCDLKASNILLDNSMNPKISDFGIAKHFGIDEVQQKTSRIAGTSGYMAPEYALYGFFSPKSDVYSYGVLLLETVTGRRNLGRDESLDSLDLLSYVWLHWKEGRALQAVDRRLGDDYIPEQALKCIQIGLMCVQQFPAQRPNMSSLLTMLNSQAVALPEPFMPAFLTVADDVPLRSST